MRWNKMVLKAMRGSSSLLLGLKDRLEFENNRLVSRLCSSFNRSMPFCPSWCPWWPFPCWTASSPTSCCGCFGRRSKTTASASPEETPPCWTWRWSPTGPSRSATESWFSVSNPARNTQTQTRCGQDYFRGPVLVPCSLFKTHKLIFRWWVHLVSSLQNELLMQRSWCWQQSDNLLLALAPPPQHSVCSSTTET